jgi:hypothetical protein
MENPQPRLGPQQCRRVRVATPAHLIVEVEGTPDDVAGWPKHDHPTQGGP